MKCKFCDKTIGDNSQYCPYCGLKQSADICTSCGAELLHDAVFCHKCGAENNQKIKKTVYRPVPKPKKANTVPTINWIKAGVSAILLLFLSIMLFLPMGKIKLKEMVSSSSKLEISYNAFDTYEMIGFLNKKYLFRDYVEYVDDKISDEINYELLEKYFNDWNMSQANITLVERAFNKLNPFSVYMISEIREVSQVDIIALMVLNLTILLTAVVVLYSLVLTIIQLFRMDKFNDDFKKKYRLIFLAGLIFLTVIVIVNGILYGKTTAMPIIFFAVALSGYLFYAIIDIGKEIRFFYKNFWIKKAIALLILMIAAIILSGSAINFKYTYEHYYDDNLRIVNDKESYSNLFSQINYIDGEHLSLDNLLNHLDSSLHYTTYKQAKIFIENYKSCDIFMTNEFQLFDIFNLLINGIFVFYVITIIMLLIMAYYLIVEIEEYNDRYKSQSNIFGIIAAVTWCISIVLTFILIYNHNKLSEHEAKIAIGQYVGILLFVGLIIFLNVFEIKPLQKIEINNAENPSKI